MSTSATVMGRIKGLETRLDHLPEAMVSQTAPLIQEQAALIAALQTRVADLETAFSILRRQIGDVDEPAPTGSGQERASPPPPEGEGVQEPDHLATLAQALGIGPDQLKPV